MGNYKYALFGLLLGSGILLVAAHPAAAQAAAASSITLLALNQPPCAVPTAKAVLRAKLAYRIADQEQSDYGFAVSIKFQGVDPRLTFSKGLLGVVDVTSKGDTLTLRYPLAAVWADAKLRRPITCYFYLHRNTGPGRSTVIAKTPAIVFQECQ